MAKIARSNGVKIEITFTAFAPTLSAEFPAAVLVGTGRVLVGRLPPLILVFPPVPFSLSAFLTNASKFSQSESFALMAPTPPWPHAQRSKYQIVLFRSSSVIWMVRFVCAVPLTALRRPELKPLKVELVSCKERQGAAKVDWMTECVPFVTGGREWKTSELSVDALAYKM